MGTSHHGLARRSITVIVSTNASTPNMNGRAVQYAVPTPRAAAPATIVRSGVPVRARRTINHAQTPMMTACSNSTRRYPCSRCSTPYVHSGSQLCTTHFAPRAVKLYGSTRGMPWPAALRMPVRRCRSSELSVIGRAPMPNPNRARAATNSHSSDGPERRRVVVAVEAVGASVTSRRLRVRLLEVVHEGQHGGADDHYAEGGEHAEHHRDEHLDRCLLRLLLGQLSPPDTHLVGLRAEHTADRHSERVGLEDGEHERPHRGHVRALVEGTHGIGPAGAGPHLPEHAGELVR